MEAHYRTQTGVPLLIGGIPNDKTRTTDYAISIPRGLSLLLADNPILSENSRIDKAWQKARPVSVSSRMPRKAAG
jgi:cytochrome bd-type quinol oxidase subunit 1